MKHARQDYNRIQDPALYDLSLLGAGCTPIAEDEPVFLIRGQDRVAPIAMRSWADHAEAAGAGPEIVALVRWWAGETEGWQRRNHSHLPDLPQVGP